MKRINIKVDSCFWKENQCPTTASFSLPDNIEEVVGTVGTNKYTGTIFKIAENSYSFIMVTPLFNNVFQGSETYRILQKELDRDDIAAYLGVNLIKSENESYLNRFEISRKKLTADFKKLFSNLDNVYDYDLAVPLPDQKEIDVITKYWQNNEIDDSSELGLLYKKGNQITVSDLMSEYRTLFESSYGVTFSSTNSWPGNSNKTYFCAEAGNGYLTSGAAEEAMVKIADSCFTLQCDQIVNEFWNQDLANAYSESLQKAVDEAAVTVKLSEEALVAAQENEAKAQAEYDKALSELKDGTELANKEYDECIAKCAGDPVCEAKCAEERDATIAKLQAALDAAAENLADAQAAVADAQAALAAATVELEEAEKAIDAQEVLLEQIQNLCGVE